MIIGLLIFFSVLALVGAAYVTNPFARFSLVKRPFVVTVLIDSWRTVNENHRLIVRQSLGWRLFAIAKCGIHILTTRYVHLAHRPLL